MDSLTAEKKGPRYEQTRELLTDTPLNPGYTIDARNGFFVGEGPGAGDSVDEHQALEEANESVMRDGLKQLNRNL